MKYDFITIGGATLDILFFTNQGLLIENKGDALRQELLAFEFGAKIRVDKFAWLFGGGASNAAVNFANLGLKTACLSTVGGDDYGRHIIANLKNNKVATELVRVIKDDDSGFSFVLVGPKSERVIFTYRAANDDLTIDKARLAALKAAGNVYVGSLSGSWTKVMDEIASLDNPNLYWNPGSMQYSKGLKGLAKYLKKTEVLFMNKDEALELVLSDKKAASMPKTHWYEPKNLLATIKSYGPQLVVITAGLEGADAYDGHTFYHQDIIRNRKTVDMTGIGDVHNSTMAASLFRNGGDVKKAMLLAAKNASAKAGHLGAQKGLVSWRGLEGAMKMAKAKKYGKKK